MQKTYELFFLFCYQPGIVFWDCLFSSRDDVLPIKNEPYNFLKLSGFLLRKCLMPQPSYIFTSHGIGTIGSNLFLYFSQVQMRFENFLGFMIRL